MKKFIKQFFALEKKPKRWLMAYEWVVMAYLAATLIMIAVMHSRLPNAEAMVMGRLRIVAITAAMWGVYRLLPCGLTRALRAIVQLALLSWWYPDIFELNRTFHNLDHIFATWEQSLFGCQPALLFSQKLGNAVVSELMCLGYACYYPMIAVVAAAVLLFRHQSFERVAFIITATFFIHYVVFIALPVTGPQYYYQAVGTSDIADGIFPNLHDYFNHHQERMACPGYQDGVFYAMVEHAHQAGERPVAAFPSSHVGVCLVVMLTAWHFKLRRLFWCLTPFAVLLFLSTIYIRAHYAIDAIAGLASGLACWGLLLWASTPMDMTKQKKKKRKR